MDPKLTQNYTISGLPRIRGTSLGGVPIWKRGGSVLGSHDFGKLLHVDLKTNNGVLNSLTCTLR